MRGGGSRGTASKFISRGITSSRTTSHQARPDRYSRALESRKRGGSSRDDTVTRYLYGEAAVTYRLDY